MRSIESMMGLSPRRGNLMLVFRLLCPPTKDEGGGHIGFSADPGCRRRRDSLYPPYFLNQWGNFTKLAWIHHWDKPKC